MFTHCNATKSCIMPRVCYHIVTVYCTASPSHASYLSRSFSHVVTHCTASPNRVSYHARLNLRLSKWRTWNECLIWASHGGDYKEYCLLGCDTISSDRRLPTFRKDVGNIFQSTHCHIPEECNLHEPNKMFNYAIWRTNCTKSNNANAFPI
jgi:hypothetical protein